MTRFLRNHKRLTATTLVLAIFLAWWPLASFRGILVAHIDLALGHYEFLGYGLPPPWRFSEAQLLRERYGIEYRQVALCIVSPPLMQYADSYNSVSIPAITRKFGRDVIKETAEMEFVAWQKAHPDRLKE